MAAPHSVLWDCRATYMTTNNKATLAKLQHRRIRYKKFLSKMYSSWSTYIYLFIYFIYTLNSTLTGKYSASVFYEYAKTPLYKKKIPTSRWKFFFLKNAVLSTCPLPHFLESPYSQSCHSNCRLHDLVIHIFFTTKEIITCSRLLERYHFCDRALKWWKSDTHPFQMLRWRLNLRKALCNDVLWGK